MIRERHAVARAKIEEIFIMFSFELGFIESKLIYDELPFPIQRTREEIFKYFGKLRILTECSCVV
jgi:hypothetical protein